MYFNSKDNYSPPETAPIREEFPSGAEITEIEDPSVDGSSLSSSSSSSSNSSWSGLAGGNQTHRP
jgi:hypothetical protein